MVFSSYEIAWYWQRFRVRQCLGQTEFSTGSLSASPAGPEGSSWPARTCNPTSEALVLHQGLDPDRHLWRGILKASCSSRQSGSAAQLTTSNVWAPLSLSLEEPQLSHVYLQPHPLLRCPEVMATVEGVSNLDSSKQSQHAQLSL